MHSDASGWLWFVMDVVLVVILGAGIAYGTNQWRKRSRNPTVQKIRDEATRENFQKR